MSGVRQQVVATGIDDGQDKIPDSRVNDWYHCSQQQPLSGVTYHLQPCNNCTVEHLYTNTQPVSPHHLAPKGLVAQLVEQSHQS